MLRPVVGTEDAAGTKTPEPYPHGANTLMDGSELERVTAVAGAWGTMMGRSGAAAAVLRVMRGGLTGKVTLESRPEQVKDEPGWCPEALHSRRKGPEVQTPMHGEFREASQRRVIFGLVLKEK